MKIENIEAEEETDSSIAVEKLDEKYALVTFSIAGFVVLDVAHSLENAIEKAKDRINDHPMEMINHVTIVKQELVVYKR